MGPPTTAPTPSPSRARAAASVAASCGIFLLCLACITRPAARPPTTLEAVDPSAQPWAPSVPQAIVQRAAGPWSQQRLGYTALSYRMPEVPEVLQLNDNDHCELARVVRDGGLVRYMIRSFEHETVALHNIDELITRSLTEVARQIGGVRRTQVALTQGGYPGADLTFDFPQTRISMRVRMLVGRTRSYAALVSYPTTADGLLRADVEHFFGGLEFDEGDQPEADGNGALGEASYVEPVGAWFAARMPGRPRRESGNFTRGDLTRPRITYTVRSTDGGERYVVAVTAFERHPPEGLLATAASTWAVEGRSVRAEAPITMQGFAGRSYTLRAEGGATVTELRAFVTRSRLYEFSATRPAAAGDASEARARAFFDSLRIL